MLAKRRRARSPVSCCLRSSARRFFELGLANWDPRGYADTPCGRRGTGEITLRRPRARESSCTRLAIRSSVRYEAPAPDLLVALNAGVPRRRPARDWRARPRQASICLLAGENVTTGARDPDPASSIDLVCHVDRSRHSATLPCPGGSEGSLIRDGLLFTYDVAAANEARVPRP